jgi:hypothetical protein
MKSSGFSRPKMNGRHRLDKSRGAFYVGGEPLPIQGKLGEMFAPRLIGGIPASKRHISA